MKFEYATGATPLEEIDGLIPLHISTQAELNEWENANILKASNWLSSSHHHGNILTIDFIKKLHKKMFDETWKWAGTFRSSGLNIGVEPSNITTELKKLLDDVAFQMIHDTYTIDEIAYRFHHRLVSIHPFPNGNGRHARLLTDFLLLQTGQEPFTWGKASLDRPGPIREKYITALKNADRKDYTSLAIFVRS